VGLRGLQVRLGCTTKILTRRCRCRLSFDGQPLPAPSTDLGGLSGGPVIRIGKVASLVGLVSQHHLSYDLLRVATFDGIDEREFR